MRAYIHIGGHKTGSTYLQERLRSSALALRELGIEVPDLGPGRPGHHGLADELRRHERGPESKMLTEASESSKHDLLVSSEDFESLDAEAVQLLLACLPGREVRVIYYFRNWSDVCHGSWQEVVKHGIMTRNYPNFLLRHLTAPKGSGLVDYSMRLSPWTSAVGANALTVIPYEMVPEGELFASLISQVSSNKLGALDTAKGEGKVRSNARLTPERIEFLRVMNGRAHEAGIKEYNTGIYRQMTSASHRLGVLRDEIIAGMKGARLRAPDINQSPAAAAFFARFFDDFSEQIPAALSTDAPTYLALKGRPVYFIDDAYLLDERTCANYQEAWGLIRSRLNSKDEVAAQLPKGRLRWKSQVRGALQSRRS